MRSTSMCVAYGTIRMFGGCVYLVVGGQLVVSSFFIVFILYIPVSLSLSLALPLFLLESFP